MNVVGLDLSLTATGVAFHDGGTFVLKTKLTGPDRLIFLRDTILSAVALADLVCIEGYSFASRNGRERLGELGGVIRVALHEHDVCWVELPPAKVKKIATGKGNAKKEEVLLAAARRLDYEGTSTDEADALWVRELALQHFGESTVDLPLTHLEALKGIEWPVLQGTRA